jgi:hypothetical protein
MKLSQLAAKPQLVEIKINDGAIVEKYGEEITFWSYDRQPLDTFMKLANANDGDTSKVIEIMRTIILDENGKQIMVDDLMLPTDVLMAAISVLTETLGK